MNEDLSATNASPRNVSNMIHKPLAPPTCGYTLRLQAGIMEVEQSMREEIDGLEDKIDTIIDKKPSDTNRN